MIDMNIVSTLFFSFVKKFQALFHLDSKDRVDSTSSWHNYASIEIDDEISGKNHESSTAARPLINDVKVLLSDLFRLRF